MKPRRRAIICSTVALASGLCALVPATASATSRPAIERFALVGAAPHPEGGVTALKIKVRGAQSCTLDGPTTVIGVEWTGHCTARGRLHRIWLPSNGTETAARYRFTLIAHGPGGTTRRRLTVVVPDQSQPKPGYWRLWIENVKIREPPTELLMRFDAGGSCTPVLEGVELKPGSWSYAHHVLTFTIVTAAKTIRVVATGPPKGPFKDAGEEWGGEGEAPIAEVSVKLERIS